MTTITIDRRRFLKRSLGGAAAIGIGAALPACFAKAAASNKNRDEHILMVVQMSGEMTA